MKDEKDKKKNKDKKKKEQKKVKNYNYFEALVLFTDYSCKAAELLHSILSNFDSEKLEEQMKLMHEIEHEADLAKHGMMKYLVKEFITPIDREDISSLAQEIDNVTDTIEDVLMQLYMYNIKTIRPEALDFSVTIVACTRALRTAMQDYHNYKKSATVIENIININNMEEDGDKIYTKAMHNLYTSSDNAIEIMTWTKNFDCLEKCCDACENVADLMEFIIMKNS